MTDMATENAFKLAHSIFFARQDCAALWRNFLQTSASDSPGRLAYCGDDLQEIADLLVRADDLLQAVIAVLNGKRKFHRDTWID